LHPPDADLCDDAKYEMKLAVLGATSLLEARNKALEWALDEANKPDIPEYFTKVSMSAEDIVLFNREDPSLNKIEVTITFEPQGYNSEDPDPDEWSLSMSMSSTTVLTAKSAVMAPGSVEFWQGSGKGSPIKMKKEDQKISPEGVDVQFPVFRLQMTRKCPKNQWKLLRRNIRNAGGSMNAVQFQGFDRGELLFTEFSSTMTKEGDYNLSYGFDVQANGDFEEDGPKALKIPNALGWDFKWAYFDIADEVAESNGKKWIPPVCDGLYSSRLFDFADFNTILPV